MLPWFQKPCSTSRNAPWANSDAHPDALGNQRFNRPPTNEKQLHARSIFCCEAVVQWVLDYAPHILRSTAGIFIVMIMLITSCFGNLPGADPPKITKLKNSTTMQIGRSAPTRRTTCLFQPHQQVVERLPVLNTKAWACLH